MASKSRYAIHALPIAIGTAACIIVLASLSLASPGVNNSAQTPLSSTRVLAPTWAIESLPSDWDPASDGMTHWNVVMLDADEGWISGRRALLHYEDDSFEIVDVGPYSTTILAMDFVSETYGWLASNDGLLYSYNGTSWIAEESPIEHPAVNMYDLKMFGTDEGWACGWGTSATKMIHWDGTSWSEITYPPSTSCQELSIVDDEDIWTVGYDGDIAHYDGTSWVTVTSPVSLTLFAIDMVSENDGWAVGERGVILKYDGTDWAAVTSPTTQHLYSIDMISTNEGWAGGMDLLYYDGESWETVADPVSFGEFTWISDIDMISSTEGWAVGQKNLLLHYTDTGGLLSLDLLSDHRSYFPRVFARYGARGE